MSDEPELGIVKRDVVEGELLDENLRAMGIVRAIRAEVNDGFVVVYPLEAGQDADAVTDAVLLDQRLSAAAFFAADAKLEPAPGDDAGD